MATYVCNKCGMGVNATFAKFNSPLVNDIILKADGTETEVSKCPNKHGKLNHQCVVA